MPLTHPGFRIFVLGAGFSRAAGLPLATELFDAVRVRIERRHGIDTKFHRDVGDYREYRAACEGIPHETGVDLEAFMSYLDIEHFLGLRGGDTWSAEGNEAQIMIRRGIGEFLQERTPAADRLPDAYYRFVERLSLHDTVITFNYDILLERALEHVGKPYRLFPHRFKSVHRDGGGVIDSDKSEVTIFKLHGSLDWFDDRSFLNTKRGFEERGVRDVSIHPVFDDPKRYVAEPIVDGLRPPEDPLLHIHRVREIDRFYAAGHSFVAPFILSPSYVKFVYATPLLDLWHGLGQAGGWNLGISIVGFSLPLHDEYIRVGLYQVITNYQQSWWDMRMLDVVKDYVRLVDYRTDESTVAEFKQRYSFLDPDRTQYFLQGFGDEAVSFLFDRQRVGE